MFRFRSLTALSTAIRSWPSLRCFDDGIDLLCSEAWGKQKCIFAGSADVVTVDVDGNVDRKFELVWHMDASSNTLYIPV